MIDKDSAEKAAAAELADWSLKLDELIQNVAFDMERLGELDGLALHCHASMEAQIPADRLTLLLMIAVSRLANQRRRRWWRRRGC